jgi:integrase
MAPPNPFPPAVWPLPYRAIGAAMASAGESSRQANCSKYLRWCDSFGFDPAELTPERAETWLDFVAPKEPWKSTRGVAALAVLRMLTQAHPERDWAWLKQLASAQGRPRGAGATYSHRNAEASLPFDQWPEDWQRRWKMATGHIFNPPTKGKSRYANLRLPGAKDWRKAYAERIQNDLGAWLWIMKEAEMPIDLTQQSLQVFISAKREIFTIGKRKKGSKEKWIPAYVKRLAAGFKVVLGSCPDWVSGTATEMKDIYRANNDEDVIEERPEHPAVLAAIGLLLIERARKFPLASMEGVNLFRDGALFFTCAYRAMRVGTVVKLKIGEHLKLGEEDGKICAPAGIMKAKRAWQIDLNADIVMILREWVEVQRPFMKNADSPFVFISSQPSASGGMTVQAIGRIVRKHSLAYLDRSLSTHDFRYATGTFVMDELPDSPWIGSAMLQHHSHRTLTVYTPSYQMASAAKRFGQIADGARKKAEAAVARKAAQVPGRAAPSC